MEPNTPKRAAPEGLRCPSCGGLDVVADFPRHIWDELMRSFGKLPKQCRRCGRRFHVREPRTAPTQQ